MRDNRHIRRAIVLFGLCLLLWALLPEKVQAAPNRIALSLGYQFGGVAGDDGVLYTWGTNYYGQLGNGEGGTGTESTYVAQAVSLPGEVVDFSAGYQSAAAILEDGSVWAWGKNMPAQISGYSQKEIYTPVKIDLPETPVRVRAGYDCMGVLTAEGSLYMWGNNDCGQLGIGSCESQAKAVKVSLPGKVTDFDLQSDHAAALLEDGSVYTWGSNAYGQLGDSGASLSGVASVPAPMKVQLPLKAAGVAAGTTQTAAVLSDGSVWIWGGARYLPAFEDGGYFLYAGESGERASLETVYTPGRLDLPDEACEVRLGAHHGAALTADGSLYTWGKNERLQLGYETAKTASPVPKQVGLPGKVIAFDLMDTSSAAVLEDGSLWGWGNNEVANLGLTDGGLSILPSQLRTGLLHDPATGVTLSRTSASIRAGTTLELSAKVLPSTALQKVSWSSSAPSVAAVDSAGRVTAASEGSCTITASAPNGTSASCSLTVTAASPPAITLSASEVLLAAGDSQSIKASVSPGGNENAVVFTSSDSTIARVEASTGRITGVREGTCTITASLKDQSSVKASLTVTVCTLRPVYRLYLPKTGEHLYTTDANEKQILYEKYGWGYEGIGWYATSSGTAVYRLYHPGLQNHLYTTDPVEVKVLSTSYGWQKDNGGKPLYYSSGTVPVYRVYHAGLSGMHHLTTDTNEYAILPRYGWKQEGVKIWAYKSVTPITTQYYQKRS